MLEEQHSDKPQQKEGEKSLFTQIYYSLLLGFLIIVPWPVGGLVRWLMTGFFPHITGHERFLLFITPALAWYGLGAFLVLLLMAEDAPAAKQDQDHLKQLNHDMEKSAKNFSRWAKYLLIVLIVEAGLYAAYVLHKRQYLENSNNAAIFYDTPLKIAFPAMIGFAACFYLLCFVVAESIVIVATYKERYVASTCSAVEYYRIKNAYENVQQFLIEPKERGWLSVKLLQRLITRYKELEQLDSELIAEQLRKADVWNTKVEWHGKGKTLDEALMLAIYTARLSEEETKQQATEQSLELAKDHSIIAPETQSRKHHEQTKEALEKELEKYLGPRSQSKPRELISLGGQYVIHSNNGEKAKIVLTLPAGEYIAELCDFRGDDKREVEGFSLDRDGGIYILRLTGRGFSDHTEITLIRKETGARDEIQLW